MSLNEMLFNVLYKDQMVNEEVRRKIQAVIEDYDELLTMFFKQNLGFLNWY